MTGVTSLAEKIVAIDQALTVCELPHAFGGALALAWCTGQARATIDIDINIFVDSTQLDAVLAGLPAQIKCTGRDEAVLRRDGQARLWWDHTPVDVFLDTTDFHQQAASRVRWERFMEREVPFLSCLDLAVFKAFFNRTKDWADLEAMAEAGTLDVARVSGVLIHYLGADDERLVHLGQLR